AVDMLQIVDFDGRLELQTLLLDLIDNLQHAIDVFLAAADDNPVFDNLDLHIVDAGDRFHRRDGRGAGRERLSGRSFCAGRSSEWWWRGRLSAARWLSRELRQHGLLE